MRSSHTHDRPDTAVAVDDPKVVDAGLVSPATPAQHPFPREVVDTHATLPRAPGRAHVEGNLAVLPMLKVLAAGDICSATRTRSALVAHSVRTALRGEGRLPSGIKRHPSVQ